MSTEWMADGKCREYPAERSSREMRRGDHCATNLRHLSRSEPVLEYALENHVDHGIWGGCSERERRRILRERRRRRVFNSDPSSAPFACSSACSTSPKVATTICSKPFAPRPVSHCATTRRSVPQSCGLHLINDRDALSHDVRELIRASFEGLDLRIHEGVHPGSASST